MTPVSSRLTRDLLLQAKHTHEQADRDYREMIWLAKQQGWNNCEIARVLGCSEAAIRLYFKRHGRS